MELAAGRASRTGAVLVANLIEASYANLVQPWYQMVMAAPFEKRAFVISLDENTSWACEAAGVPHASAPRHPSAPSLELGIPRTVPQSYPIWKFIAIVKGLDLGWRVLWSEIDALWMPPRFAAESRPFESFEELLTPSADLIPMRHPNGIRDGRDLPNHHFNAGFMLAQGRAALHFFRCAAARWEERKALAHNTTYTDQDHINVLAKSRECGNLTVGWLSQEYCTCRAWVSRRPDELRVAHITYCDHIYFKDATRANQCKRLVLSAWYLSKATVDNVTDKLWNRKLMPRHRAGC